MPGYPLNPGGNRPTPAGWTGTVTDPGAPAGGNGPGSSQPYSRQEPDEGSWFWGAVHGAEHFADSAYHSAVGLVHDAEDTAIRVAHVAQAIYLADDYAGDAIRDKIGMDIAELKKAFIPGLVMSLGVLAITTLAGATVAGILVGALTAGAGAVPAAVAGGELGLDAGFLILDAMGIGFLLREVFGGISEVFDLVKSSMSIAWNAGSNPRIPPMTDIEKAAQGLAAAVAEMVNLLLQGVLIWILKESAVARAGKLGKGSGSLTDPGALATRGNQVLRDLGAKSSEVQGILKQGAAELAALLRKAGQLTRGLADFVESKFEQILKKVTDDAGKKAEELKSKGAGGGDGDAPPSPPSNKRTLDQIPHARRNGRLAGGQHPKTGIPFNERGYPVFDSAYDVDLPKDLQGSDVSDNTQFKYATGQLKQDISDNPDMADQFTDQQLEDIKNDSPKIDGYTWHHNENGVTLQLVDQDTHALTGHDGGRLLTGGRP